MERRRGPIGQTVDIANNIIGTAGHTINSTLDRVKDTTEMVGLVVNHGTVALQDSLEESVVELCENRIDREKRLKKLGWSEEKIKETLKTYTS